jgi:cobaltochelatase CobN
MITDAVALAASAKDDLYPNYVAEGSLAQEKELVENGKSPQRARELANMRVFGPANSGYSTGMLRFTESSGEWDNREELVNGFINNMCAMYGDEDNWGNMDTSLFRAAIANTDMIVQPRQSNTWGPISLDHVYEFTGAMSLAATSINGKEPDAVLADYRNAYLPRLQDTKEAIAIEARATILNPEDIKQRMKGDATTAQMFGEIFRNIFGWSATRQSALSPTIYDDLYDVYIADANGLGIEKYFERVNPAALQEMTATMMESARKGYWKADRKHLEATAQLHARLTERNGAPCTEFVCANSKLQEFTASNLDTESAKKYLNNIAKATAQSSDSRVLKEQRIDIQEAVTPDSPGVHVIVIVSVIILLIVGCAIIKRHKKVKK